MINEKYKADTAASARAKVKGVKKADRLSAKAGKKKARAFKAGERKAKRHNNLTVQSRLKRRNSPKHKLPAGYKYDKNHRIVLG